MTAFNVGDRVRVTFFLNEYAGSAGEVVGASRTPDGNVYAYEVSLDASWSVTGGRTSIIVSPHELELAPSDTP